MVIHCEIDVDATCQADSSSCDFACREEWTVWAIRSRWPVRRSLQSVFPDHAGSRDSLESQALRIPLSLMEMHERRDDQVAVLVVDFRGVEIPRHQIGLAGLFHPIRNNVFQEVKSLAQNAGFTQIETGPLKLKAVGYLRGYRP